MSKIRLERMPMENNSRVHYCLPSVINFFCLLRIYCDVWVRCFGDAEDGESRLHHWNLLRCLGVHHWLDHHHCLGSVYHRNSTPMPSCKPWKRVQVDGKLHPEHLLRNRRQRLHHHHASKRNEVFLELVVAFGLVGNDCVRTSLVPRLFHMPLHPQEAERRRTSRRRGAHPRACAAACPDLRRTAYTYGSRTYAYSYGS